jgi:hypothetical protein
MKQSPGFLRGFLIFLGILLGVALYAALALFPIIEDISQIKRDKKDLELQIEDFKRQAHRFFVIDEKERLFMERDRRRLLDGVPVLPSVAAVETTMNSVKRSILGAARKQNLPEGAVVVLDNPELDSSAETAADQWTFPFSSTYRQFSVVVSAPLQRALNFLNLLPGVRPEYLSITGIRIKSGNTEPLITVSMRFYYCLQKGCEPVDLLRYAGRKGVIVDNDSEILLERVYWYTDKDIEYTPLTSVSGTQIFVERSR